MNNRIDKYFFDASIYNFNFVANNKTYTRTVMFPFDMEVEKKYLEKVFKNEIDLKSVEWLCDSWCPKEYFTRNDIFIDE